MPKTWSDTDDKRLFLAILQTVAPTITSANWTAVAAMLGNDLTASACMQHFNKLKNKTIGNDSDTTTTPRSAKSKSLKTPVSKKRKTVSEDADNESDIDTETKNTAVKTEKIKDEDEFTFHVDADG